MYIKSKLTEKEFISGTFVVFWMRPAIKVLLVVGLIVLGLNLFLFFNSPTPVFSGFVFPIVLFVVFPTLTYFQAKATFNKNPASGDMVEYQFDDENVHIKSATFNSSIGWKHIKKVHETKNWVLLYNSNNMAYLISKKDIWQGEIASLKTILDKNNIKNNL